MSNKREKWNIKNMFALIIGIDNYRDPNVKKLRGAVADADRFGSFLRGQVKVENDRIIHLRNEKATRKEIENAFCSLWQTESINYGEPIVVYFAGHGCKIGRPASWETGGLQEIEGIFPYDIQPSQQQGTNPRIFPIPDRTIAAWLNILSHRKGNNITVIFDCCHSTSGARGEDSEIPRAETFYGSIPDDIDKKYLKILHGTVEPNFPNQHSLSHVFLAACGADESATEIHSKGKFTTALLNALDAPDVDGITYAQFMKRLKSIPGQTPQCDGHFKNRILFSNALLHNWGSFPVFRKKANLNECHIYAGSIHGVHKNTLFNMYERDAVDSETNRPICILRATQISPFDTKATITKWFNERRMVESGFARQKCSGKALKVHFTSALRAILNKGPGHPDLTLCLDENNDDPTVNIHGEQGQPDITVIIKKDRQNAEFIIGTDANKNAVFTTNIETVKRHGFTRLPEVVQAEPAPIVDVLRAASQWIQHLDSDLTHPTWIDSIEINFHYLKKTNNQAGVPDIQPMHTIPLTGKNTVSLEVPPDSQNIYGMSIKNKTVLDLHVSIVLFDIDNLHIRSHFSGALGAEGKGKADPSLRKGKYLTIGYGNGGGTVLMFDPPKAGINVTILKLYFTTMPMDIGWLEQESPFSKYAYRGVTPKEQIKQFMTSPDSLGGTTLFTIVQHAAAS